MNPNSRQYAKLNNNLTHIDADEGGKFALHSVNKTNLRLALGTNSKNFSDRKLGMPVC